MEHMGYHMCMARKEVLVQLDDSLVSALDRLAAERGTSRSDLVRRGVLAVLDAADVARSDHELQEAYRRVPPDPALVESARRFAAETTSPW